jgi:hypothetical protein
MDAGWIIFENLPMGLHPRWAAGVLEAAIRFTGVTSELVEHIVHIAHNPGEWKTGHDASSSARRLSIELGKGNAPLARDTVILRRLIALAVLVARVAYNCTRPPDPFDEDTGPSIAKSAKYFCDVMGDDAFSASMWSALASGGATGNANHGGTDGEAASTLGPR